MDLEFVPYSANVTRMFHGCMTEVGIREMSTACHLSSEWTVLNAFVIRYHNIMFTEITVAV